MAGTARIDRPWLLSRPLVLAAGMLCLRHDGADRQFYTRTTRPSSGAEAKEVTFDVRDEVLC